MAFLFPIDEIREVARDVGLGAVEVEPRTLTDAIRVTRADGLWVDLDAEVFIAATRGTWEPLRHIWEPLVRRELEALAARAPAGTYTIILRRADGSETSRCMRAIGLGAKYVEPVCGGGYRTYRRTELIRDPSDHERVTGAIYTESP